MKTSENGFFESSEIKLNKNVMTEQEPKCMLFYVNN